MPKGAMKSVDARRFAMTPKVGVPRSAFDVAHTHKTTFNVTYLFPVYVDEVIPGDSVRLRMHAFARLSTPIVPVLDNLILETFFFFVPHRLVWSNFERFMGEQLTVTDTTTFLTPQVGPISQAQCAVATLYDYMGITLNAANSISVLAFPFRAYNLIWNDFFRDQDLVNPAVVNTGDGPDAATDYALLPRYKRPDYFTTCRPWPQKPINMDQALGVSDPFVPGANFLLRGFNSDAVGAPLTGIGVVDTTVASGGPVTIREPGSRVQTYADHHVSSNMRFRAGAAGATEPDIKVLVNDIRTAIMVQTFLERNARGGTRYAEIIRSHFGVISPDSRLQRPEYLGGGRSFVSVNPVNQTSATNITGSLTELGEQAGTAQVSVYDHGFSQSFTEHGTILGMVNMRADLTYQEGIERMWFRRTQFDFYWPELAHLGEQAVLEREIYAVGAAADTGVFGYQERWSEYKYKPSRTSGYFRSGVATPLDMWHFGQEFSPTPPVLNSIFITDVPPVNRVLQVTQNFGQQVLMDSLFEVRKVRPMPMYSVPGLGARL